MLIAYSLELKRLTTLFIVIKHYILKKYFMITIKMIF